MNRLFAPLLALPLLVLPACQDNSALEREVASLKVQVAELKSAPPAETKAAPSGVSVTEVDQLRLRLERAEADLTAANKKITDLEARPAATPAEKPAVGEAEAAYKQYKDFEARNREEQDAERKKRETDRVADMARIAKENGIDFDEKDVAGSIRKIMTNPEQREKAFKAMRNEADKQRYAKIGLDERQVEQVKKIEADGREKVTAALRAGRENGTPREDVQKEVEQVAKDKETELKTTMTEDQYKKYVENGGPAAAMGSGGMGDLEELMRAFGGNGRRNGR